MYTKEFFKNKYVEIKQENGGRIPKRREFELLCKAPKYSLEEAFGKDCYSKLQMECGDKANKLNLKKIPTSKIFDQWGMLAKKHKRVPLTADWLEAKCKPKPDGLSKPPHNLKWSDIPQKFFEYAKDMPEWREVIDLIKKESSVFTKSTTKQKSEFDKLYELINSWTPDRKRNSEESYKIELRNFLTNNKYTIKEESGETRSDLVVEGKYSIELKKDPSLSEYDRLFGQLIRHGLSFGAVIAVVVDISSLDKFEQFSRNVDVVFEKIDIDVKLVKK